MLRCSQQEEDTKDKSKHNSEKVRHRILEGKSIDIRKNYEFISILGMGS